MQPSHPSGVVPDAYGAIIDDNARREDARRLAATRGNTQPEHGQQPETTTFIEIEPKNGRQISAEFDADAAPVPKLDHTNAALVPATSPNDSPTPYRITARVAQLKVFLQEEGDQFSAHIRNLQDLEEFEKAMELLDLDEQLPDLSTGYPLTEDGFVVHCRVLFDAMKNLVNILDFVAVPGATNQSGYTRSGDSLAVKFVKSKKPIEINIVAGKLMRAMLKAQQGRLPLRGKKFHQYGTFTLRFQAVVDALRVSKLLVRSAFESDEWIDRIVINPGEELNVKKLNKTVNESKAVKHRFANQMKKNDPNINFKDYQNIKSAQTSTSPAIQSPASQAQQRASQWADAVFPQIQAAPNPSPAPRLAKRVKTSHDQLYQPEESGPSSAYKMTTSQNQQHSEGQVTGPDLQSLQAPQDGSLDAGITESRIGNEALRSSMEERSEQTESGRLSTSTPQGRVTARNNDQAGSYQGGTLALDPNPLNVPGPIQQYGLGLYSAAGTGSHAQPTSGLARFRAIGGTRARIAKDGSQQSQAEDLDHDD